MVIGPVDAYGDGSCDWSLGDDFDGAVDMPDDYCLICLMMEPLHLMTALGP